MTSGDSHTSHPKAKARNGASCGDTGHSSRPEAEVGDQELEAEMNTEFKASVSVVSPATQLYLMRSLSLLREIKCAPLVKPSVTRKGNSLDAETGRKVKLARHSISSSQLREETLAFFTLVQAERAADAGHGKPEVGKGWMERRKHGRSL